MFEFTDQIQAQVFYASVIAIQATGLVLMLVWLYGAWRKL